MSVSSSGLSVCVAAQLGPLSLEIAFAHSEGTLVLAGPNGAGKSSLLALLLGRRRPARGRVAWAAQTLFDSAASIDLPAEARGLGWMPQGESLFPHLTAQGNVEFAVAARHPERPRAERVDRARAFLERLGASSLASRKIAELSGGERQRIALARAVASEPRAQLLDEPLAAHAASARPAIRDFIARTISELRLPSLIVTHDRADAAAFASRVIAIEEGRIVQDGSLAALEAAPLTEFVRRFTQRS